MTEKFIAASVKGKEFLFDKSRMIAVPKTSAQKIADALNKLNYKLKDSETWFVHNNDSYFNDFIDYEIKRYGNRMPVHMYRG